MTTHTNDPCPNPTDTPTPRTIPVTVTYGGTRHKQIPLTGTPQARGKAIQLWGWEILSQICRRIPGISGTGKLSRDNTPIADGDNVTVEPNDGFTVAGDIGGTGAGSDPRVRESARIR